MRCLTLTASILFILSVPSAGNAQSHAAHCRTIDSAAEAVQCLKSHADDAQDRLNKAYEALAAILEETESETLKQLQQSWLSYRDAECAWEAGRAPTPPQEQMNKLSCIARMTENRTNLLTVIAEDSRIIEHSRRPGDFPRWMSALTTNHPGVFWKFGERLQADLDCDGQHEMVMPGVTFSFKPPQKEKTPDDQAKEALLYTATAIIAIAQNAPFGHPETQLIHVPFDYKGEKQDGMLCHTDISLKVKEEKRPKKAEQEPEAADRSCQTVLTLRNGKCAPVSIGKTDTGFGIAIPAKASRGKPDDTKKPPENS